MNIIHTKTYTEPPINEKEILRYAGCRMADENTLTLLRSAVNEGKGVLTYKVCYRVLPVAASEDLCDFGALSVRSQKLAYNLRECDEVILFGATVGVDIDRLITKYSRLSPSKAVMLQAFGAERIEALCDLFCEDIEREKNVKTVPRFSPGYGDLPLEIQKEIFDLIDCRRKIGLCLNDSMLMSPTKSVTAFMGLRRPT